MPPRFTTMTDPTAEPGYDVFFSYDRDDEPRARRIAAALAERRLRVWIDRAQIQAAERWAEEIEEGLGASRVYAMMVTGRALESRWVKDEYYAALAMGNAGGVPRIVALLAEDVPLPVFLRIRQCVDFRRDEGFAAALEELEECIRGGDPQPNAVEPGANATAAVSAAVSKAEIAYLERALARERGTVRDLRLVRGAGVVLGMVLSALVLGAGVPGGLAGAVSVVLGVTVFTAFVAWAATSRPIAAAAGRENRLLFLRDKLQECAERWDPACERLQREFWRMVHGDTGAGAPARRADDAA